MKKKSAAPQKDQKKRHETVGEESPRGGGGERTLHPIQKTKRGGRVQKAGADFKTPRGGGGGGKRPRTNRKRTGQRKKALRKILETTGSIKKGRTGSEEKQPTLVIKRSPNSKKRSAKPGGKKPAEKARGGERKNTRSSTAARTWK